MEWIKNNPGQFTFYVVLVLLVIYDITLGRKIRARNFEKKVNQNKSLLCARCGQAYQDNYYTVRKFNYCSSCFEFMMKQTKLGLGFFAGIMILGVIFAIFGLAQDYARGLFNMNDFVKFLGSFARGMVPGGLIVWWLLREYNQLKKAKEPK